MPGRRSVRFKTGQTPASVFSQRFQSEHRISPYTTRHLRSSHGLLREQLHSRPGMAWPSPPTTSGDEEIPATRPTRLRWHRLPAPEYPAHGPRNCRKPVTAGIRAPPSILPRRFFRRRSYCRCTDCSTYHLHGRSTARMLGKCRRNQSSMSCSRSRSQSHRRAPIPSISALTHIRCVPGIVHVMYWNIFHFFDVTKIYNSEL
ncbi:hypothetical protein C8F01DRAFT_1370419, partial [Mycena amicta]